MPKENRNPKPLAKEYEPYGPEWEKEMMKLPKHLIIKLYRNACMDHKHDVDKFILNKN